MRPLPHTVLLLIIITVATTIPTTIANARKQLVEDQHSECWRHFDGVDWCREDLYISWKQKQLGMGVECCKRIEELGDACFQEIFQYGPFSLLFGAAVKGYCSWIESPPTSQGYLPQSTSAPQPR